MSSNNNWNFSWLFLGTCLKFSLFSFVLTGKLYSNCARILNHVSVCICVWEQACTSRLSYIRIEKVTLFLFHLFPTENVVSYFSFFDHTCTSYFACMSKYMNYSEHIPHNERNRHGEQKKKKNNNNNDNTDDDIEWAK